MLMTRVSGNVQVVSGKTVLIASRHADKSTKVTLMVLLLLYVSFPADAMCVCVTRNQQELL